MPKVQFEDQKMREIVVRNIRVSAARKNCCKYNSEIAREIGRSANTIGNWMRNPDAIKLSDFRNLVKKLKMTPEEILECILGERISIR